MSDFISKHGFTTTPVRSNTMRTIKSKNTKPELKLRRYLWNHGIRYRINNKQIIGNPDITLRKKKIAIFVDGEFWHGYNWHEKKYKIKTNRDYWIPKIERNIKRDQETTEQLIKDGWIVLRFWEREILDDVNKCYQKIIDEY